MYKCTLMKEQIKLFKSNQTIKVEFSFVSNFCLIKSSYFDAFSLQVTYDAAVSCVITDAPSDTLKIN